MLLLENAAIRSMSDTICGNYQADILEGSILIDNGKILEVSPKIELPKSADCMKIDVHHHLVMPGLIEAHCHMGITEEKRGRRVMTAMRQSIPSPRCSGQLMPSTRWTRRLVMR